ncbi:hypothetical protein LTR66_013637 [Elasticomyces elasticus]|nr:hypothetical protein LTR66_013637 [Elasticomyces elasticus]
MTRLGVYDAAEAQPIELFGALLRPEQPAGVSENHEFCVSVTRAPMRQRELAASHQQFTTQQSAKQLRDGSQRFYTYWLRWDARLWIRLNCRADMKTSLDQVKIQCFLNNMKDHATLRNALHHESSGNVADFLARRASVDVRRSLPVLTINDEIIALPTLNITLRPDVARWLSWGSEEDIGREMAAKRSLLPLRAAICHVSPIFLSAAKTTEKAIKLIHQASKHSANLVVFPETFIPAFPVWSALSAPYRNHSFFARMAAESVYHNGEEMHAVRSAARDAGVLVNIGFSEKARHSSATLYNSNMLIGDNGEVLVHHRKLMPTFFEKLTWSPGDGHGLRVAETRVGKIGTLICGENTNPLARFALMCQAEQVHISTWPGIWPTRVKDTNTATSGEVTSFTSPKSPANYDNVAANRIRSAAHCFEAKCFGIMSAGLIDDACKEAIADGHSDIRAQLDAAPQAASMFLDPTGALLQGYTIDEQTGDKKKHDHLQNEPGVLYADLDLSQCIEGKQYHDVTGGYQRLDVFNFEVDRTRKEPATFYDDD